LAQRRAMRNGQNRSPASALTLRFLISSAMVFIAIHLLLAVLPELLIILGVCGLVLVVRAVYMHRDHW
jgi:hypothetical protein